MAEDGSKRVEEQRLTAAGAAQQAEKQPAQVSEAQRDIVARLLKEMGQVVFVNLAQPAPRAVAVLEIEMAAGEVVASSIIVKNRLYQSNQGG